MKKDFINAEMLQTRRELEQEIVAENMMGIDFLSLSPGYLMTLLTNFTEDLLGFGAYLKD